VRKVSICILIILALVPGLVACGQPVAGEVVQSDKQRETSPDVNEIDLVTLIDGNSAFAFDLYQAVREKDSNLFYSPYSISIALAMTYAGAHGETSQQMADTLHFLLSQDRLHPAFNALDLELARRGEGAEGKDGEGFRLNVVNAIWGQKDYNFLPKFLDTLAWNYGDGLRILDFASAPEESRITINKWVSDQTEGRIENLIPQGLINALTRLVLTNAIYFNAAWDHPFYDGGELSMIILLPQTHRFEAFEGLLDAQRVEDIVKALEPRRVTLTMPRFEFKSSFSLRQTLAKMGMPVAFSGGADFSGMTGNRDLFIADVVHKAFVSVDEAGTEAAAATAVVMELTAVPGAPVELTIDHPFIFIICDIETGAILFVGRVLSPGA